MWEPRDYVFPSRKKDKQIKPINIKREKNVN